MLVVVVVVVVPGIALAAAGFAALTFDDYLVARDVRHGGGTPGGVRRMVYVVGALLLIASLVVLATFSDRFPISAGIRVIAGIATAFFLLLMVYSLVFEVSSPSVYMGRTRAEGERSTGHEDVLVTTGTYALCRHPGVLWFAGTVGALSVVTASRDLATAAPALVLFDLLHAWYQDRVVMPIRYGSAFANYRRSVPMVIPRPRTIRAWSVQRQSGEGEQT